MDCRTALVSDHAAILGLPSVLPFVGGERATGDDETKNVV
jgi:hypothetical protein